MGGRKGSAEAQMPPDVPTQWPKAEGSHRLTQNGGRTEGIWLVTAIWRPRVVWMPRQNWDPSIHPSESIDLFNDAVLVCWPGFVSILSGWQETAVGHNIVLPT